MRKFVHLCGGLLLLAAVAVPVANAVPFANSLWLGNDTNASLGVLNTDRLGNVLRTLPGTGAVGFAVDLNNNILYINQTFGSAQPYDLTTLLPAGGPVALGGVASEDLSFDGTNILAGDFGGSRIVRINPATGLIVDSIPIPFVQPLGLTWDGGTGFWVTPFAAGGAATHFDALGNILSSFVPFPNAFPGGMGYDTTDGTLWIGTFGSVSHFTTGGTLLGSFTVPDGRFIDGLEFEGGQAAPAPEPGTLALLAAGLALVGAARRRKQ
jgi:hypothetical protein